MSEDDLVYRLRKRAEIRRSITGRKSVQEGQPDRLADLLDEAADRIEAAERVVEVAEVWRSSSQDHEPSVGNFRTAVDVCKALAEYRKLHYE